MSASPEPLSELLSYKNEALGANLATQAQARAEAIGPSLKDFLSRGKGFGGDFSWEKLSSQIASAVSQRSAEEIPKEQISTIRGQIKARNLPPRKAVVKQVSKTKPKPKQIATAAQPQLNNVFGGLFKQETVYIDDD